MRYQQWPALIASVFLLSACGGGSSDGGGGGGATQKSSDISFASISVLGSNVNDPAAIDAAPEISSNGLELYFQSTRLGGSGSFDLWVSTRASEAASWGIATNVGAIVNSASDERGASLSDDGLTLIFASNRAGGYGSLDLYISTRAALNGAWSAPVNLGAIINTAFIESGPSLTSDGLSLFFHSDAPGAGNTDLFVSVRPSVADPWGAPVNLGGIINSTGFDSAPDISSDGLSLYFHSDRVGGPGSNSIWRSIRASTTDAWNAPTIVPAPISSASGDVAPSLSDNWQTLYFSSTVGSNPDIWQAVP